MTTGMETRIYSQGAAYQLAYAVARQPSTIALAFPETQLFPGQQSVLVDSSGAEATPANGVRGLIRQVANLGLGTLSTPAIATLAVRTAGPGITALDAIDAVAELFGVSAEAVAAAAGIGRTTPMHWRRTGAMPRPSTVGNLWRLYGFAMRLRAVFGWEGTRSWMRSGDPSPLSLLNAGNLGVLERLIDRATYDPSYLTASRPSFAPVVDLDVELGGGTPARASRRHVRRGRLGG